VVAAGAASCVRPCEWHAGPDEGADKQTRNDLPHAELPHVAHLPSAFRAEPRTRVTRYTKLRRRSLLPCGRLAHSEHGVIQLETGQLPNLKRGDVIASDESPT
jgi:hypothetical protein